jgi:hypothetical protein
MYLNEINSVIAHMIHVLDSFCSRWLKIENAVDMQLPGLGYCTGNDSMHACSFVRADCLVCSYDNLLPVMA